ncbi:hypothetical protein EV141_1913 [Microcella putealis]|uniref:Prepilin-type N-terminal cleavage/methylation domain-containing protein n=1 Tax=Microcella putealis TaxID=337005 RepID=A0A4Q7LS34_9MICO|nr:type II secretion system protein [Microcella putealis]RZS56449.1 hypothetical protein EV141_1913 [Microcella putealis]TQM27065.1 hypothetical protein BJ957_0488 [Microcella putealis]
MIRRKAWQSDDGVSLPELLVTMFLTGIVGLIVVSFFVAFTNTFNEDRAASDSTTTAALGMNDLTRIIRSGTEIPRQNAVLNDPVFTLASNEEMVIHAYVDTDSDTPAPIRIRFFINADNELVEERFLATQDVAGYWSFASTSQGERVIARQLPERQPGQPWLFTYLTAAGATFTIPEGASLSVDQRRSVAAVRITLTVQADTTAQAEPVTLRNTVGIPNLGVARVGL